MNNRKPSYRSRVLKEAIFQFIKFSIESLKAWKLNSNARFVDRSIRGDNKRRTNELIAIATAGTATTINQHDFTRSNLDPLPIRRRYRRLPFESSLSLAVSSRRFPFLFLLLLAAAHTLNRVLNKRHVKRGGFVETEREESRAEQRVVARTRFARWWWS